MGEREVFEGMVAKFLLNLPREEQEDATRLSYHAEKAFYYYVDEVLRTKPGKDWEKQRNEFLFKLKEHSPPCLKINPQLLILKLQENKPVCGAIIFNRDCSKLLVIKVKDKLGFPKGKWNQQEPPEACAAREVQEETGIALAGKFDERIRIEFDTHGNTTYFFVAKGVSEAERLRLDKKEVDDILWMRVEEVRKGIAQFVERSRIAWSIYEKEHYRRDCSEVGRFWKRDSDPFDYAANPLLHFKLDRNRLYDAIFAALR